MAATKHAPFLSPLGVTTSEGVQYLAFNGERFVVETFANEEHAQGYATRKGWPVVPFEFAPMAARARKVSQ